MLNDIIADGLTRIRNASMRGLEQTTLLHSKLMEGIVKILREKGYISNYRVETDKKSPNKKYIVVTLKYEDGEPVIHELTRVSKPGRRVYKGYQDIRNFKNGYGVVILSTNKGILPNDEAYRLKVGGEVLCTIW
ncbi:MAG: 30S ribosomal protein S8 [Epsilonproteobacteria bacterium]|nr:30S ribosomal protein S8 [Campylobacterota bacterium]NPA88713.1 30S ribosomal protein S8 [Campylobacterota bacterium]